MAGRLGEWSVEDLLQIAKITQKTTSIELIGKDRSGVIYLRDGGVVDAELIGVDQPAGDRFSRVVEVIIALTGIEVGSFQFGTREVPFVEERPVDINAVFAALEKDLAREKRLVDLGISGLEGLGVARHVADPLTLKPAVWQLLADLIEPFSLTNLERRVGRRKAVAIVLTLDAIGVLSRDVELPEPRPPMVQAVLAESNPEPVHDGVMMESVEMPEPAQDPGWADEAAWARAGLSADSDDCPPGDLPTDSPADAPADSPAEADATVPVESNSGEAAQPADSSGLEEPEPIEARRETVDEDTSVPEPMGEVYTGEPVVEIFGMPSHRMHEVVTPSETTLVSDVLGDLRSRFRSGRGQTLEPGYDD
ncbi:MAG: DUF4388 domain-containing protein [Acidimicrobiia bacterium]